MIFSEHVDEVVITEELLTEGMSDEVEGIGTYVGEDLVGELCVSDVEDKSPDEVVGGQARRVSRGFRLLVPEGSGVTDESNGVADERRDEERAREVTFFAKVSELLEEKVEK